MKTKQTPSRWQEVKLGEILKEYSEKNEKNYIQYTIGKNGIKPLEEIRHRTENHKVFRLNNLILGIGIDEINFNVGVGEGCCSPVYSVFDLVSKNINNFFLYYYLRYILKNFKNKFTRKSTRREFEVVKGDFLNLKIPFPKLEEQQKIAKILSCVDNVIDKTQEIIEGYERVKQGLMDELLVKGIGHKEFKKVKLGNREIEIPESWEVRGLGEIFEILKSYGISRKHLSEENEIKCFHYGDIHNFKKLFFDVGTEKISNCNYDFFGQREIEFLKEGDVVLVDASEDNIDIGKTISIKNIGDFKCVAGLHTFLLRRKLKNIYIDYSVFLLNNKITKAEMGKISTGISVYGISKTNLKKLTSFIPPLPEQKTISKILQTQDNLIQLEKQSLTKLKQIKKGLMQKLLTGEIRV